MSAIDRQREQLLRQIGPVVQTLGYELDDVAVTRVGRRSLVRVTVDSDHGIDLDGIADVSRAVSTELDTNDPFGTPFVLEVSSPGIDRPLTEPRHWRRNRGRLVATSLDGADVTARIGAVDDAGVTLLLPVGERVTSWSELGAGRVQVEFGRPSGRANDDRPIDEEGE
jgi:ribosome maturation factor RimP